MRVIVVEDNVLLGENIKTYLKLKEIEVDLFLSVEEAEEQVKKGDFQVLILDINLPGKSGLEYLKELRERGENISIIMLTSNNTSDDIVLGLETGADDYISKPFNFEEFTARIRTLAKRKTSMTSNIQKVGDIEVDLESKKIKKDGISMYLPTLEYNLVAFLLKQRGKIIDRATLYEEVWGEFDKYQLSRTVDVYVGYVRKKLGKDFIQTKKGEGYFIN